MNLSRDFAKITASLKQQEAVEIPLRERDSEEEQFVRGLITKAVSYLESPHFDTTLQLLVGELIANAHKAVAKRIYFRDAKISPVDASAENLKQFARALKESSPALKSGLAGLKFVVLVRLTLSAEGLRIDVENPGVLFPDEAKRIGDNLRMGFGLNNISEVDRAPLGSGEGVGNGLALVGVSMKKAGLPASALTYTSENGKTAFVLKIAPQPVTPDVKDRVDKTLLREIESIPSFPEHIKKIIELCDSPNSDARQISKAMEQDPAIVSQMLRMANSGGFAGGNVAELQEAVTIIGLANIAGLMLKIGAYKVLGERYTISEEMQDHPVRVAFYTRELAKKFKLSTIAEQCYAAGLLHDIGKIVLVSTIKDAGAFGRLAAERDRRVQINMEEIQSGVSHAVLGALLAQKWKFPPHLCQAIEHHHTPHMAEESNLELVYLVYLANMLADTQKGHSSYQAIEPEVLARFNLTTEDGFNMLAAALSTSYREA